MRAGKDGEGRGHALVSCASRWGMVGTSLRAVQLPGKRTLKEGVATCAPRAVVSWNRSCPPSVPAFPEQGAQGAVLLLPGLGRAWRHQRRGGALVEPSPPLAHLGKQSPPRPPAVG